MPSRHSKQTVYRIDNRYFSIVGVHPDSLGIGSLFRAACDHIEGYQGGNSGTSGYVTDAMWRVVQDCFATEAEVKLLTAAHVIYNPLSEFRQFRVIGLHQCSAPLMTYRQKYRLRYLWWTAVEVRK